MPKDMTPHLPTPPGSNGVPWSFSTCEFDDFSGVADAAEAKLRAQGVNVDRYRHRCAWRGEGLPAERRPAGPACSEQIQVCLQLSCRPRVSDNFLNSARQPPAHTNPLPPHTHPARQDLPHASWRLQLCGDCVRRLRRLLPRLDRRPLLDQQDVTVEAAVPGAIGAGAAAGDGGPPPAKKRKGQQAALPLPAIPTVVAPAPKPGAAPAAAAAAATSNWAALKAVMDAAKQQQEASRPHWQRKRKAEAGGAAAAAAGGGVQPAVPANRPQSIGRDTEPTKARTARGWVPFKTNQADLLLHACLALCHPRSCRHDDRHLLRAPTCALLSNPNPPPCSPCCRRWWQWTARWWGWAPTACARRWRGCAC